MVSFGTAWVDINGLVRHRSTSLDLLIISPVLLQSHISNCWVRSPAFHPVCFLHLHQVCLLPLVWVSISSISEFACRFISWFTGCLFSTCLLTLLVISSKVHSSTNLELQFSAGKCVPRYFLAALPVSHPPCVRRSSTDD